MDFRVRFTSYLSWQKDRKEHTARFQGLLKLGINDVKHGVRRNMPNMSFLSKAVYSETDTTSIYLTYCELKENAERRYTLQVQIEVLRKAARQQVSVQSVQN